MGIFDKMPKRLPDADYRHQFPQGDPGSFTCRWCISEGLSKADARRVGRKGVLMCHRHDVARAGGMTIATLGM